MGGGDNSFLVNTLFVKVIESKIIWLKSQIEYIVGTQDLFSDW